MTTLLKRSIPVFEILKSLELRKEGAVLVACPSCGRADVDVVSLANTVDDMLKKTKSPIKVAVMGCEVNGPGEAKDADVGIAAGAGRAIIFRKGPESPDSRRGRNAVRR